MSVGQDSGLIRHDMTTDDHCFLETHCILRKLAVCSMSPADAYHCKPQVVCCHDVVPSSGSRLTPADWSVPDGRTVGTCLILPPVPVARRSSFLGTNRTSVDTGALTRDSVVVAVVGYLTATVNFNWRVE